MSRSMSVGAVSAMGKPQTTKIFLYLLTVNITIDGGTETYYFVNNTQSVIRNSQIYTPLGFRIVLPSEGEDVKEATLELDATNLIVVEAMRKAESRPTVSFILILADDADGTPEAGPFNFDISDVSFNAQSVRCTLKLGKTLESSFPKVSLTPYYFPGLF